MLVYGLSAGHVASVNTSTGLTVPCACTRTTREVFAKAITAARGTSNRGSSSWNLDIGVQRREGLIGGGLCGVIEELVGSACYAARCRYAAQSAAGVDGEENGVFLVGNYICPTNGVVLVEVEKVTSWVDGSNQKVTQTLTLRSGDWLVTWPAVNA